MCQVGIGKANENKIVYFLFVLYLYKNIKTKKVVSFRVFFYF